MIEVSELQYGITIILSMIVGGLLSTIGFIYGIIKRVNHDWNHLFGTYIYNNTVYDFWRSAWCIWTISLVK